MRTTTNFLFFLTLAVFFLPGSTGIVGQDGGEKYSSETEEYQADNGILVRVRPERWLSVDYS